MVRSSQARGKKSPAEAGPGSGPSGAWGGPEAEGRLVPAHTRRADGNGRALSLDKPGQKIDAVAGATHLIVKIAVWRRPETRCDRHPVRADPGRVDRVVLQRACALRQFIRRR
jgi:hypothetical protein